MQSGLTKYTEKLKSEELNYLERKELSDRKQYIIVLIALIFFSLLFPFAASWKRGMRGDMHFSLLTFFFSGGILLAITLTAIFLAYKNYLQKLQLDIKEKTKTIEGHKIIRKVFNELRNTGHFFIDSRIILSIEVSGKDFAKYKEGDEVYIEFASNSELYIGYF